jgi:PAS domain S-box-containing protein
MTVENTVERGVGAEVLIDMVLALVPDAAVVVDEQAVIVAVNQRVGELFGYPGDELVGLPVETLVPERFRHRHRSHRSTFLTDPRVRPMGVGLDLCGRRRDGSEFPVDISLAPIETADRRLAVAAVRDTSERQAIEAAHAQLAAIVRSSLDAILTIAVDGRITSWNAAAEQTFGYSAGEITGGHISRLIPADASPAFEEQLERAQQGEPSPPVDAEWTTQSGDVLSVAVSVSPLTDSTGAVRGFSVLARDITERKQAEAELRRVLAVSERHARWQEAAAEIRLAVLNGRSLPEVLALIALRTGELMGSSGAALLRASGEVVAASGSTSGMRGASLEPPAHDAAGEMQRLVRRDMPAPWNEVFDGPAVVVLPIGNARQQVEAVLLCDTPAGVEEELTTDEVAILAAMAQQAAMAVELERARADQERLLLADERGRIARDLHDHAVQALFATGLSLQGVVPMVDNPRVAGRVQDAIESLDETIKQIRTAIFTLSAPAAAKFGLRAEVVRLTAEAGRSLGFEPAVVFDGPVDVGVPPEVAAQIVAVVREALSNVARHARASSVSVEVRATPSDCEVRVVDDGVGFEPNGVGNGLANMGSRANDLGGELDVTSAPGHGTKLIWCIPLD